MPMFLVTMVVTVCDFRLVTAKRWSSSFSSSSRTKRPTTATATTTGSIVQDPYISSAPLIVATECSDGIALLALHPSFAEEPLLLDPTIDEHVSSPSEEIIPSTSSNVEPTKEEEEEETEDHGSIDDPKNTTVLPSEETPTSVRRTLYDIPQSYRGPFRIYPIDRFGTSMICAGWRTHTQLMIESCRDVAKEELYVYGPPRMEQTYCVEYGNYLAQQTSVWLAYTGVMKRHRWACVGLLATCSNKHPKKESAYGPGCLWLVDKTGAYRVRAHAVGGGLLAGLVNQFLASEISKNDKTRSAEQALRDLLAFLCEQTTLIPQGTRAELAIITPERNAKRRLRRVFISELSSTVPTSMKTITS